MTGKHHQPDETTVHEDWLAELAHDDAPPTEILHATLAPEVLAWDPLYSLPPQRRQQVIKTLAFLDGLVSVWDVRGQAAALARYLDVTTVTPNAGNLRQYREFHHAVEDAATILRYGYHPPETQLALPAGETP